MKITYVIVMDEDLGEIIGAQKTFEKPYMPDPHATVMLCVGDKDFYNEFPVAKGEDGAFIYNQDPETDEAEIYLSTDSYVTPSSGKWDIEGTKSSAKTWFTCLRTEVGSF